MLPPIARFRTMLLLTTMVSLARASGGRAIPAAFTRHMIPVQQVRHPTSCLHARATTPPSSSSSPSDSRNLSNGMEDPSGPLPNARPYSTKFGDDYSDSKSNKTITYIPIAVAHTPFQERHGAPRQPTTEGTRGQADGIIRLLPDRLGGKSAARATIDDLESFSHVIVLAHLHLNTGYNVKVTPPRLRHLDNASKKKGVLATRAPHRPNNIGLSILKLHSVDLGKLELHVEGIDLIDQTPIIDIKPYIKQYDAFPTASSGWVDEIERLEMSGKLPKVSHDGGTAAEEAENHRKYYSLEGVGKGSSVTMQTNTCHELATDVPKKMGGKDSAPQPVEHLLAALIGCTQATAIFVGRMMSPRLLIDRVEFNIQGHRDERGALMQPIDEVPNVPARLEYISGTVTVHFKGKAVVSEAELELLKEQTEARCPVANMMLASGCIMDIDWVNGNNSDGEM